jgi:hypothetical protein
LTPKHYQDRPGTTGFCPKKEKKRRKERKEGGREGERLGEGKK